MGDVEMAGVSFCVPIADFVVTGGGNPPGKILHDVIPPLDLLMDRNKRASAGPTWAGYTARPIGPRVPHTAYSAAKFAVKGFTEALITDLRMNAPHIKCSVLRPTNSKRRFRSKRCARGPGRFASRPSHPPTSGPWTLRAY